MEDKTIYIVRHGETEQNRLNIVQGSGVDSSLNAHGRAQAEAFYQHYNQVPFSKVYVSALQRTRQSVQPFIDTGVPVETLAGLNEISWGVYEGVPHSKEFHNQYLQRVQDWRNGLLHLAIDGGESPDILANRQKPAIQHILAQPNEPTVLVCTHGRALKALLCQLLHLPLTHMDNFEHRNLGLYRFSYQNGLLTMTLQNDAEHLSRVGTVADFT